MINKHEYLKNPVPIIAQWDITSGCNFRCVFCLTSSSKPGKELNTSEAYGLIDKLHDAGILFLRILGGEPFFRRDTVDILQYAARKGMILAFSTNASMIDERVVQYLDKISYSIRYLQVSLYGISQAGYRSLTGNQDGYRLVQRGLELLDRHDLDFTILTVATDENVESLPEYYDVAVKYRAQAFRICSKVSLGRAADNGFEKTGNNINTWVRLLKVLEELAEKEQKANVKIRMEGRPMLGMFLEKQTGIGYFHENCTAARTMIHIDARGRSRPCPFLAYLPTSLKRKYSHLSPLDIATLPFSEVWESDTFNTFRDYYHPVRNLSPFNTKCPHFKNKSCIPCPITPCTCPEIIRRIKTRLRIRN